MIRNGPRVLTGIVVREPRAAGCAWTGGIRRGTGPEIVVAEGDWVEPSTIVARMAVTGEPVTVEAASILGISPGDLRRHMVKAIGERVSAGECLAACKGWMGLVVYVARSPVTGVIRDICPITGAVAIEAAGESMEVPAGLPGVVAEVRPGRGVVVQSEGALVQGVYGLGGFAWGRLAVAATVREALARGPASCGPEGCILVVDTLDGRDDICAAAAAGATAIVAWSATCVDITSAGETAPVLVAGGFGDWPPSGFSDALAPAGGLWAAVNGGSFPGCLFIAGVRGEGAAPDLSIPPSCKGEMVRVTAGPLAGRAGYLHGLAAGLHALPGGLAVRCAMVLLDGGREALIPAQNLERADAVFLRAQPCPGEQEKGS